MQYGNYRSLKNGFRPEKASDAVPLHIGRVGPRNGFMKSMAALTFGIGTWEHVQEESSEAGRFRNMKNV